MSSRPRGRKRHQTKTKDVSAVDVVEDEQGRGKPRQRVKDIYVNPKHYQTAKDKARLLEELNESRHKDSYCQLCSEYGAVLCTTLISALSTCGILEENIGLQIPTTAPSAKTGSQFTSQRLRPGGFS